MAIFGTLTDVLIAFGISPIDYPSITPYMLMTPNATTSETSTGRMPNTNGVRTLIQGIQRALAALGRPVGVTGQIEGGTDAAMQELVGNQWRGVTWTLVYTALANKLRKIRDAGGTWDTPPAPSGPLGVPVWGWALLGLGVVFAISRR